MAENEVIAAAGNLMEKKYAGIPFPLILVGVAGTAFIIRKLVKSKAAANDASSPQGEGYAMDVSGNKFASAYTGQAGGVPFGSGSLTNAGSSGVSAISPVTEVNNEGWLRRATEKLNLLGQWNVTDIQTALQTYISGGKLDQRQSAIVQQATKVEGIPPLNVNPGAGSATGYDIPTLQRFIQQPGNYAIFGQYSDGSVKWIPNPQDLYSTAASSGNSNLYDSTKDQVIVHQITAADPLWQTTPYADMLASTPLVDTDPYHDYAY